MVRIDFGASAVFASDIVVQHRLRLLKRAKTGSFVQKSRRDGPIPAIPDHVWLDTVRYAELRIPSRLRLGVATVTLRQTVSSPGRAGVSAAGSLLRTPSGYSSVARSSGKSMIILKCDYT